jgi:hypothetical protein
VIELKEQASGVTLESKPKKGARRGCGCLVAGFGLLTLLMLVISLFPAMQVTLDCSRRRGNCTDHARTTPLAEIQKAVLVRDHRGSTRGYRVRTVSLELQLDKKKNVSVCTSPADDPDAAELKKDVDAANAFFTSPAAEAFVVTCNDGKSTLGERIYYPLTTGLLFVGLVLGFRAMGGHRVEVDDRAKVVRIRGLFGSKAKKQDIPFADIESVALEGNALRLQRRSGLPVALAVATDAAEQQTLALAKARIDSALSSV